MDAFRERSGRGWGNGARRWSWLIAGVVGLGLGAMAWGAPPLGGAHSRQSDFFVVHESRALERLPDPPWFDRDPDLLRVEPQFVMLTGERIRDALVRALQWPPREGGKIHCTVFAAASYDDPVVLHSILHPDGWQYRVGIPDDVRREKLVRAFVQVILLEFANRGTAQKTAEIPTWLIEGWTGRLMAEAGPNLVVDSVPKNSLRRTMAELKGADPTAAARALGRREPLWSFGRMADVTPSNLASSDLPRFQASAQLFLAELLRLPQGMARMNQFLRELPKCWNWQTALVRSFPFERLIDVEKWWTVAVAEWGGRNPDGSLNEAGWLDQMDRALAVPAEVRFATNALPVRSETSLTDVIANMEFALQRPVLERKMGQLIALRRTAPPALLPLIDDYRGCLGDYLQRRARISTGNASKRQPSIPASILVENTCRRLAELELRRSALRTELGLTPREPTSAAGQPQPPQGVGTIAQESGAAGNQRP